MGRKLRAVLCVGSSRHIECLSIVPLMLWPPNRYLCTLVLYFAGNIIPTAARERVLFLLVERLVLPTALF